MAAAGMPADELARRASGSARWAVFQSAGKHGIDLLIFLILAKLLAPQTFGLVALAGAVVVLGNVLVELGLGDALIQRADLQESHLTAAFWMSLGMGSLLTLLFLIASPWLAQAAGQPALTPLMQAMAPLFVLNALTVVPQALLQRHFAFRRLALRALAAALGGGLVGVGLAAADAQAWALVGQQLVSAAIGLLALYWRGPWRPGGRPQRGAMRALMNFGQHVLGTRMLNVAASKADVFLVGLVLGPVALGFYSVACRLLLALEQLFCQGVDAVALSAFSRTSTHAELRALLLSATRIAALLAIPVFGGLMTLAPDVVSLVLGANWLPSAELLRILLAAGLLQALLHFNHAVFKACNRPDLSLRLATWSTGLNLLTLGIAVHIGVEAVAWSYLLRTALVAPFSVLLSCRAIGMPVRVYLSPMVSPALACLAAVLVIAAWETWAPAQGAAWGRLLAEAAAGLTVYLGGLALASCATKGPAALAARWGKRPAGSRQ